MRNDLAALTREYALEFTSWPSVTGTAGEAAFAQKLCSELSGFDRSWTVPIPNDYAGRSNVFAIRRGKSPRTIVLTGHFDVVPVDDYGELGHLAFNPEALLDETIRKLRRTGENPGALADFESGNFLPGRGLLDMKAGLAAGLAAAEAYGGDGTILFLAVADEEDRSAGMRAAAPHLREIADDLDLDIRLVINLDAISDQGDGSQGRVAALGSIGKQLLTAFVIGRETHACYPEDGANAAYIAAELLAEFELAPELAEHTGGEIAAPPTALHAKDLKSGYNVTTPGQAWIYWNTLQHRRPPAEVMAIALALARRAMVRATARLNREIPVMPYADLAARIPSGRLAEVANEIASLTDLDLPERSKRLTSRVWSMSGLSGPAVVMGFGSVPYAAVALDDPALEDRLRRTVAPFSLGTVRYFPGISDMSFLGKAAGAPDNANTPMAGSGFPSPQPAGFPAINIGPWGRDYHHWLERLHAPYAFETLPRVLHAVLETMFESD